MDAAKAAVEAELRRVVEENLRLRGMLEELTRSYGALYHQLLQVTQQQQQPPPPHRHPDLVMNNRLPLTQVSAHITTYTIPTLSRTPSLIYFFPPTGLSFILKQASYLDRFQKTPSFFSSGWNSLIFPCCHSPIWLFFHVPIYT